MSNVLGAILIVYFPKWIKVIVLKVAIYYISNITMKGASSKRHGFSHALATIISIITAGLLLDLVRSYVPILKKFLFDLGSFLSDIIFQLTGKEVSPSVLTTVIFASILAFIWGLVFEYIHRH